MEIPPLKLPFNPTQRRDVDEILAAIAALGDRIDARLAAVDINLAKIERGLDDLDRKVTALASKVRQL